jgi:phosphate transporter
MKFGQTLKYNAIPDWLAHYMAYDQCKHMLEGIRLLKMRLFYASDPSQAPPAHGSQPSHHDSSDDDEEAGDDDGDGDHAGAAYSSDEAGAMTPTRRRRGRGGASSAGAAQSAFRRRRAGRTGGSANSDDDDPAAMSRSASQAVLLDLGSAGGGVVGGGGGSGAPPPLTPPLTPRCQGDLEEGLSARELHARLDHADAAFFDKLAAEAVKVDHFYGKMMVLLPQYSHAHEQRVAQLLEIDVAGDEEEAVGGLAAVGGGGGGGDPGGWSSAFADADDRTPLIGLESAASASAAASALASASSPRATSQLDPALPRLRHVEPPPPVARRGRRHSLATRRQGAANAREAEIATLRARLCNHYLDIVGMINFSKLNTDAFDKILKKHDKITGSKTREAYMDALRKARSFPHAEAVERLRDTTEALFARAYWKGDVQAAKEELLEGVRDQIIWSRNTVWRDMLRIERKVSAFRSKPGGGKGGGALQAGGVVLAAKVYPIAFALVMFVAVLLFPGLVHTLPVPHGPVYTKETLDAAHRCLALLVVVVVLWAQDGLPLYVTGFIVLPGTVLLRLLLGKDGVPLAPREASERVFQGMSSSTLMLIICVYTLHSALSKFQIDKKLASEVLSRIRGPEWLLLAVMILAVLMSMLVSNVASPVLLNSVVLPVLRDMPRSGRPFVQCILLGIAVASNIGGMPSPISSPQNAVALGLLKGKYDVPFVEWLQVTLPLCALMITLSYLLLVLWFKPQRYRLPKVPVHKERFGAPHYAVIGTVALTVILWSWHRATSAFGSAGMVAALPVIVFYGSGLLDKEDFNNLPWDVVYLVAGGIVLGNAVGSSRLLDLVAGRLHYALGTAPVWVAFAVFSTFMAVVANMVSHTVSAIIVLPVIMEVGVAMGHPRLLVMGGVLACSGAMALPVSSFPNMAALGVVSDLGDAFVSSADLLRVGVVTTTICTAVVLVCGYAWMSSFGY